MVSNHRMVIIKLINGGILFNRRAFSQNINLLLLASNSRFCLTLTLSLRLGFVRNSYSSEAYLNVIKENLQKCNMCTWGRVHRAQAGGTCAFCTYESILGALLHFFSKFSRGGFSIITVTLTVMSTY